MESGVATRPIEDFEAYHDRLNRFVFRSGLVMKPVFAAARTATRKRVIYGDGEDERVLRAAQVVLEDAVALADPGLLERVLVNIIDNALRYGGDNPVRVNAGRVGERVLITIADEGPGIPRGAEEQLFAPFQRLGDQDNSTGVGLGLSVASGFVTAMGGTISATDTPGGGLTVVIELAATQENDQ